MAELTADARHILARLELLMHGKTASWDSSGGKSDDRNPVPQGEARPPADHWRRIFMHCAEHDLPSLIREAQEELRAILVRDRSTLAAVEEEPRDAWEARLIEEGEGHEAKVVATSFRCSVQVVTKLRRRESRDPNLGHVLQPEIAATPEEKRQRVQELRSQGLSTRDVANRLGMHQTQVVRWGSA